MESRAAERVSVNSFYPGGPDGCSALIERIEERRMGVLSRNLISHDTNRGMASRAADSRWDRGNMTKGVSTGRGKDEAFVGRGGVV
jgi:hypothetical protein